jgi:ribosomal protein L14
MLQIRSILDVADNTGAKRAAAIGVLGRNQRLDGVGERTNKEKKGIKQQKKT